MAPASLTYRHTFSIHNLYYASGGPERVFVKLDTGKGSMALLALMGRKKTLTLLEIKLHTVKFTAHTKDAVTRGPSSVATCQMRIRGGLIISVEVCIDANAETLTFEWIEDADGKIIPIPAS